jgi:ribokinase
VIVVGAINVDLVVRAPRLPGPGETVVGPGVEYFGGGKGANAAVAAARIGAEVALVGAVGDDDLGRSAIAELRADGIDANDVATLPGISTGVALIMVDPAGENLIAVGAGANDAVTAGRVREALRSRLPDAGCVLVSAEIPDDAVVAAVETATRAGVPCVLNPAPVSDGAREALGFGPIVTPNEHELADLGGADAVRSASGSAVIVTRGAAGVDVLARGEERYITVPAHPAEVRDTTGAGDTFNGVLAARLAARVDLEAAVGDAVAAAGRSVEFVGARSGMPTATELAAWVSTTRRDAGQT